jgi:hypothetical protein
LGLARAEVSLNVRGGGNDRPSITGHVCHV